MLIEFMQGSESFTDPTLFFRAEILCYLYNTDKKRWAFLGTGRSVEKDCLHFPVVKCLHTLACEYNAHHGSWAHIALDLPSTALLVISLRRGAANNFGEEAKVVRKLLVMRPSETAPLRRIVCGTTGHAKAARNSIHFEGKFSLLSEAEIARERDCFGLFADQFPLSRDSRRLMPDLVPEACLLGDRMFTVVDVEKSLRKATTQGILRARRPGAATVTYTTPRRRL
jgi:hypothetical protein